MMMESVAERIDVPKQALWRPGEVATLLHVCTKTVYRRYARGDLKGVRMKRSLRIYRESIVEFLNDYYEEEGEK